MFLFRKTAFKGITPRRLGDEHSRRKKEPIWQEIWEVIARKEYVSVSAVCVRIHVFLEKAEWSRETPRALNAADKTRKPNPSSRHINAQTPSCTPNASVQHIQQIINLSNNWKELEINAYEHRIWSRGFMSPLGVFQHSAVNYFLAGPASTLLYLFFFSSLECNCQGSASAHVCFCTWRFVAVRAHAHACITLSLAVMSARLKQNSSMMRSPCTCCHVSVSFTGKCWKWRWAWRFDHLRRLESFMWCLSNIKGPISC